MSGWQRYIISAILGILATGALSPFFIFPLLFIAFSGLLLQLDSAQNKKQAFAIGWWFGFGHFVTGLYWISYSLLVDAESFAWLIPFAVSLIPAIIAVYIGLACLATYIFQSSGSRDQRLEERVNSKLFTIIFFASAWVGAELLRAHLLSGFPWNLIGYSMAFSEISLQSASIWGVYGLSLIVVLIASTPYVLISGQRSVVSGQRVMASGRWLAAIIIIIAIAILLLWSINRIGEKTLMDKGNTLVRIVQPNISQELKWNPETRIDSFSRHLDLTSLSTSDIAPKPDIIVWPESALPFLLEEEPEMRKLMVKAIPDGSILIAGLVRREKNSIGRYSYWNSIIVLNHDNKVLATYNKHKLVPFGEFIPLRSWFPFINKITHGDTDFSSGEGSKTLLVDGFPTFSPLICYEGIFSGRVTDRDNPPEWLLNVTNDGWFGVSTGPHQHFQMARMRAVEEGIPLVRAANTGISGVVDSYGEVISKIELGKTGIIDITLPNALKEKTLYSKFGEGIPIVMILSLLLFCFMRTKSAILGGTPLN